MKLNPDSIKVRWLGLTEPTENRMSNVLSLRDADAIADAIIAQAREAKLHPITVAIVDPGGALVVLKREDGSGYLYVEMATAKAWTASGLRRAPAPVGQYVMKDAGLLGALTGVLNQKFLPIEGSILLKDKDGTILGGVGVGGPSGRDKDHACALAGIAAAGFVGEG
jgi:uncharacterized protein GlcG (DUF336 family)